MLVRSDRYARFSPGRLRFHKSDRSCYIGSQVTVCACHSMRCYWYALAVVLYPMGCIGGMSRFALVLISVTVVPWMHWRTSPVLWSTVWRGTFSGHGCLHQVPRGKLDLSRLTHKLRRANRKGTQKNACIDEITLWGFCPAYHRCYYLLLLFIFCSNDPMSRSAGVRQRVWSCNLSSPGRTGMPGSTSSGCVTGRDGGRSWA